jgi:DNA repair protein RecN (Recombination protein N)
VIERLLVSDFALVDRLELEFGPGLTVLTGETGAGKSILLQALGLLLGVRASRELVRTGAAQAVVEGVFSLPQGGTAVPALLDSAGISLEDELVIRRVITSEGKSRAFVNGSSVGVSLLSKLGAKLVEVSSQHQHQALMDEARHLEVLDMALDDEGRGALGSYTAAFALWDRARIEVARLERMESEGLERGDFLRFQIDEIHRVEPEADELERLTAERQLLANAERLTEAYTLAEEAIYGGDGSALEKVGRAGAEVTRAAVSDSGAGEVLELMEEAKASLDEAARVLRTRLGAVQADPARLERVEERFEALRRLERKHGDGVEAILAKLDAMEKELWELDNRQLALEDARVGLEAAQSELDSVAAALTQVRRLAAGKLEEKMGAELERLALGRSAFLVEIAATAPTVEGVDAVRFLLAPNIGEEPKPLIKIASGGELSRVMLALKSALRDSSVDTLVFDEVDAGIGGVTAEHVGERLQGLARECQVICVTHLVQIASRTRNHLRVAKEVVGGRTFARVAHLGDGERVEELARMLGGADLESAKIHAIELSERCDTDG